MVAKALAIAAFIALAGCMTTGGSFCDVSKAIRLSPEAIAALSDSEVNAILAHNEKGRALCGWTP